MPVGVVRFEAGETVEDGERGIHVEVSEAHLTLLTLPPSIPSQLGRMLNRFGMLNQIHEDDLPQIDRPNVLTRFLGPEGPNENARRAHLGRPAAFYLEALVGLFSGDNEVAFGRGSLRAPGHRAAPHLLRARRRQCDTARRLRREWGDLRGASRYPGGVDFKYKLVPDGWRHPLLTVGSKPLREPEGGRHG